jgi:hypothetical protein
MEFKDIEPPVKVKEHQTLEISKTLTEPSELNKEIGVVLAKTVSLINYYLTHQDFDYIRSSDINNITASIKDCVNTNVILSDTINISAKTNSTLIKNLNKLFTNSNIEEPDIVIQDENDETNTEKEIIIEGD